MDKMSRASCDVVLCDRRAGTHGLIQRSDNSARGDLNCVLDGLEIPREVKENIEAILVGFREVYLCHSGMSCSTRLRQLQTIPNAHAPVVVFLDIDPKEDFGNRLSREHVSLFRTSDNPPDEGVERFYGMSLLKHLVAESHQDTLGRLIIPIALIREGEHTTSTSILGDLTLADLSASLKANVEASSSLQLVEPSTLMQCLDAGAADAFNSPLTADRMQQVIAAAYKAHLRHEKERPRRLDLKRIRRRSWVGVEEERPYAYLREAMVSSLMNNICRPETAALGIEASMEAMELNPTSRNRIADAIGVWAFSAHEFSDDELLHGAYLILSHCLQSPELSKWRLSSAHLKKFLYASRAAYNRFVLYHNFRHVVDVLQALFFSLIQIGVLPPYPAKTGENHRVRSSPIAFLLDPLDALILLVSAIGHDVGHPGVNNAFLVTLKAPLAQLYNDRSVLEAFHCAAYSQILRRHWKVVYEDVEFRRRLINTILATDMGIHPEYMANLGNLQEKLHHDGGIENWAAKLLQGNKDLILGLLIKCADISNVARPFATAEKWAQILQREFARQGEMEQDVGMQSTLFGGPPELGNVTKLANSQIGFMNFFSLPLFEGVADVLPDMHYAVDEVIKNKGIWEKRIEQEKKKKEYAGSNEQRYDTEGAQSPRSASPDRTHFTISPVASHPEGLPASGLSPEVCVIPKLSREEPSELIQRNSLTDGTENFFTPPASPKGAERGSGTYQTRFNDLEVSHQKEASDPFTSTTPKLSSQLNTDGQTASNTAVVATSRPTPESRVGDEPSSTIATTRVGSQNFSRPYSHSHSAQPSCTPTRSSASRAPTFSSTNFPTSPTETHATSVGDNSEIGSPALQPELDRPPTGYSGSGMLGMSSSGPSRASRASVSIVSETAAEKAQTQIRPVTSGTGFPKNSRNREKEPSPQIRRKTSRWKFDFWRRKRQAERESQAATGAMPLPVARKT